MSNLSFGILTITFCAAGYFFSWRYWTKDNYKIAVLLLVICGLALRVYTSTDFFLHNWDERYHALVAKNLIQHPFTPTLYENPILPYDYKNWIGNHIWLAKPPLPLWFMSISIYLLGNNEIAIRLPSLIISTLSILLTFKIAQVMFNDRIALLAAFLHSIHGMLIELSAGRISSDHVETFFIFFIELAVWFGILSILKRKKNIVYLICCGVITGFAFLSKFLPAFIVFPVWLSFAIIYKRESTVKILTHLGLLVLITLFVSLSWIEYTLSAFPIEGKEMVTSLISPFSIIIQEHTGPPWYYLNNIRIVFGELIYIPLVWILYKTYKDVNKTRYIPLLLWIIIPLIVFSFAETKRHTYLLITAPAIFIVSAYFWYWLLEYKIYHKHKWFFNLILFLLIALPIRYTIERIKPFDKRDRNPQWVTNLKKLNTKNIQKGVLFNYDKPIEAMFYTNLTAYSNIPDKKAVTDLIEKGYTVIINDNDSIPEDIRTIKGVTVEKL